MGRDALFVVTIDEYQSSEEDEKVLAPCGSWWVNAHTKPLDETISRTVNVDEDLIWRAINGVVDKNGPNHVLVSGSGGSGKSFLLQKFRDHCPVFSEVTNAVQLLVTGPTGVAAQNVDGETIHRALALGLADESPPVLFRKIQSERFRHKKTWNFLMNTRVLIIDEISMVTPAMFQMLDFLFRSARGNSMPFGGCILIMFGDFLQLPPINKGTENQVRYVFQTEVWNDMNKVRLYLNRNYRQQDAQFIRALDEVRFGNISDESEALLKTRIVKRAAVERPLKEGELRIEPLTLFATKRAVEECNSKRFAERCKLATPTKFLPWFGALPRDPHRACNQKDLELAKEEAQKPKILEDRFPVNVLEVCPGAQVMIRCNAYFTFGGVVNGTMGIVTKVSQDLISVACCVRGKFLEHPLDIARYAFRSKYNDTVDMVVTQFPMMLAWASSIHKSQSLTLDSVCVDPSRIFESGQFYVAISRVRKLEDLYLSSFDRSNIKADNIAIQFESVLEGQEGEDGADEQDAESEEEEEEEETEEAPRKFQKTK
jgi:ATP-dependent DNA helicase PIF1